jgi:hypothetical protein
MLQHRASHSEGVSNTKEKNHSQENVSIVMLNSEVRRQLTATSQIGMMGKTHSNSCYN